MSPSKKRKPRNSTIDSVNFFNEISGSSAPSRRNTTHSASTPPRDARRDVFDIPVTPPKRRRAIPPQSEPPLTRQLRSRNIDISPPKAASIPEDQTPASSPPEVEEADEDPEPRDEANEEEHLGLDHDSHPEEENEEEETRQEENEHEEEDLEEDPLPNRVNLWPEDSDNVPDDSSDGASVILDDQPTSYQKEPKFDNIEVVVDNRSSVDQPNGHDHDPSYVESSVLESEESEQDDDYFPWEDSEGERQRAQQLQAIDPEPTIAVEPVDDTRDEQPSNGPPINESPHKERSQKNELQDLSRWLAQEIESSPQGALWEILRNCRRNLRKVAIKPIPEYLTGANSEVTEMRQLYYDIINTSTLSWETQKELSNLREAVRTEATRIFEYAAEEAPEETGEGAELLNQFEAHVVGSLITLATFGYRAYKMLGSTAYAQFEGMLELLMWCCTQIFNYAQTSYLMGTQARSKAILLPLRRITKALGMGSSLGASGASSRVSSSIRPTVATQGDMSFTQDDSIFTQWTQVADYDIPPSQRPWSQDEENALRDGVRRFSEYGDPIPLVMSHYGHRLRRRTCRDLKAKLDGLGPFVDDF
ncbi:uncharacterized protein N7496_003358 [Penicillium cataractarum]|uniref:Uncharacterized protein n=1 Tax=Penicillium cataractarum TaxID=2100454 RepID=A0A9W9SM57_9EURO|nr:uncharacterized protein N7496_003358 [Penicillium cataractarum]KAJ5380930.1 hypothetical protein N7496_003358 [Penicillium cataractarum]